MGKDISFQEMMQRYAEEMMQYKKSSSPMETTSVMKQEQAEAKPVIKQETEKTQPIVKQEPIESVPVMEDFFTTPPQPARRVDEEIEPQRDTEEVYEDIDPPSARPMPLEENSEVVEVIAPVWPMEQAQEVMEREIASDDEEFIRQNPDLGYIIVQTRKAESDEPVANVPVIITRVSGEGDVAVRYFETDEHGNSAQIGLPTPDRTAVDPETGQPPYATYNMRVQNDGYYIVKLDGLHVFSGELATIPIDMIPLTSER